MNRISPQLTAVQEMSHFAVILIRISILYLHNSIHNEMGQNRNFSTKSQDLKSIKPWPVVCPLLYGLLMMFKSHKLSFGLLCAAVFLVYLFVNCLSFTFIRDFLRSVCWLLVSICSCIVLSTLFLRLILLSM